MIIYAKYKLLMHLINSELLYVINMVK